MVDDLAGGGVPVVVVPVDRLDGETAVLFAENVGEEHAALDVDPDDVAGTDGLEGHSGWPFGRGGAVVHGPPDIPFLAGQDTLALLVLADGGLRVGQRVEQGCSDRAARGAVVADDG